MTRSAWWSPLTLALALAACQSDADHAKAQPQPTAPAIANDPPAPAPVPARDDTPDRSNPLELIHSYLNTVCPADQEPSSSIQAIQARVGVRKECITERAGEALLALANSLKANAPKEVRRWLDLAKVFEHWAADTCQAVEELKWVELSTRLWGHGLEAGLASGICLANLYAAWTGLLEKRTAKYIKDLFAQAALGEAIGLKSRALWLFTLQQAKAPPGKPENINPASMQLDPKRYEGFLSALEGVVPATEALTRSLCGLIPEADDKCPGLLANWLFSLIYIKDYR